MLVLQTLRWLLLGIEIVIALPIFYLCIVSVSAILTSKKHRNEIVISSTIPSLADFAILIPAHNEIAVLGKLLESLTALKYPKNHFDVYVVADNCTDTTAELARTTGWVHVYERFDQNKRGKGFALNWLLQKLNDDRLIYDAYIVLDADSVVHPAFLEVMNKGLAEGAQALQAHNNVLNTSASPSTALRWIALTLINHVRPLGRNGIGASSTLTGNGMCLSHNLLMRHPWQAFGIAEDYQYYLTLVQNGERVRYMPGAIVRSHMPTTFAQMRTQDVRWEASESQQAQWRIALRLLSTGIRLGSFIRIEAVAELLTPPLSFLVSACLLIFAVSVLLWGPPEILLSLALLVGLACYIATAFYLLRPARMVYIALLHAPGFMFWKLWVYFVLSRSRKHRSEWVRTSRSSS